MHSLTSLHTNTTNNMSLPPQTTRRLVKEIRQIQSNPPDCVRIEVDEADILAVKGWVQGPPGTPFEGGYFLVTFAFTSEFPAVPPQCRMPTKSERGGTSVQVDDRS